MGEKRTILIQLDTDPRPSAFDAIVAVDSGAEVILPYGGVKVEDVRDLVYGAIFTRGGPSLGSTAIFVGGSDVALGEQVLAAARKSFLGPLRVSLMLDSGGANTTAAAATVAIEKELRARGGSPEGRRALVLGGTGPVGRRVARLLSLSGAGVAVGSRSLERASAVADEVRAITGGEVAGAATSGAELSAALEGVEIVVAAGGPGVRLLSREARLRAGDLRLAVDLNAVPPEGIEGIAATDAGAERDGIVAYGAIGVGEIKMKIHKAAIRSLFESNQRTLDAEEILGVARDMGLNA